MENGTPATKQDIERLEQKLDQSVAQLRSELNHVYNDLVERMADNETRVLKALYGIIETN